MYAKNKLNMLEIGFIEGVLVMANFGICIQKKYNMYKAACILPSVVLEEEWCSHLMRDCTVVLLFYNHLF